MNHFAYHRADNVADVLARIDETHLAYAGGTDLLPRLKQRLVAPGGVIDIKRSEISDVISVHADHIRIGALATLADLERHPQLRVGLEALGAAARQAATPQIRNRATLGGNLLQRPRCWYYRDEHIDCWLKGGSGCPAREGRNEHHAIFIDSDCVAAHPSDLAGALLALDASIHLRSRSGTRRLAIGDLYASPTADRRRETVIEPDEIITAITVPTAEGRISTYHKAMDRKAWAFALAGVAVAGTVVPHDAAGPDDAGLPDAAVPQAVVPSPPGVRDLRIVLTGVATTPRRALAAERVVRGGVLDSDTIERAARAAVEGATPLAENRYKARLIVALTRRALTDLVQ